MIAPVMLQVSALMWTLCFFVIGDVVYLGLALAFTTFALLTIAIP